MYKDIEALLYKLVSIKSDTGTDLEKDVEEFIYQWLKEVDYFKENTDNFGKYVIESDPLKRSIVWGLVKGEGNETVILLHHHDVVDSYDYGILQEFAYDPNRLKDKLINADLNEDASKDLNSGEWIFGRGTADMKAGAAIHMCLLKEYSEIEDFKGNILFMSVPDEESLSLGARKGVNLLKDLKEKYNLSYALCIDGEPHERDDKNRGVIYEGSVGKTMVVVYVRGKKTHIGHIFQGLNPSHILSEIVTNIDMNPVFSDIVQGEVSPPPSWSYVRDTKEQYDASIPESAGGYFSVLTLTQTPKEILENIKKIAEKSFEDVIKRVNKHYSKFRIMSHLPIESLEWDVDVKLFSDVYKQAMEDSQGDFANAYHMKLQSIKEDIAKGKTNIPNSTLELIGLTLDYLKDKSPKVVIAFSPPYYPHISNLDFASLPNGVKYIGDKLIKYAHDNLDSDYIRKYYFMGISDLSYFALNNSEEVIPYIQPNMPHWGHLYDIPLSDLRDLSIPIINIGPWGKDYHKFTERVLRKDVLKQTPELTRYAIDCIL